MNMLNHYKFTEKEQKEILKNIVITVDTREQENSHIINEFDKKKIQHKSMKLDFGDYSFMLPGASVGADRDMYFDREIVIERKNSLEELSHNLAQDRDRFEREFMKASGCRIMLLIENGSYEQIMHHQYKTELNEKAYLASLFTFRTRYGIDVSFIRHMNSWNFIYATFYYHLKNLLLKGG